MRVSFDLDDTLICFQPGVPQERPLPCWLRVFVGKEPLRAGTVELCRALHQMGVDVCVYTTSFRRPSVVNWWLRCYGVKVEAVINQALHRQMLSKWRDPPSKHPPSFGIDLHIDDSTGVALEGERYGFNVLVVSPGDHNWADSVLSRIEELRVDRLRSA